MSPAALDSLEWIAITLSVSALIVASISDFKTREVSNRVWLVYGPLALALFAARIVVSADLGLTIGLLISAGITVFVAFLLFQFSALGGADSKALMCLGLALPVPPGFASALWQAPLALYPFPIGVLANSFLLSIASGVFILGRNIVRGPIGGRGLFNGFERESMLRKLMILFTSYKTSFNSLESRTYLYPAEQVELADSKPVRRLRLISSAEEDRDKLVSGLESYKSQGLFSDGIWVTPGLPHLVFMTASLIIVMVIGDLLMWGFFRIVGYA